jgi:hypothetical protein
VSKHSPLPWRKGNVSSIVSDGTPDGQPPNPEQFQNFYGGQPVCVAMFETDADLVLQAVNSHADLLAALNRIARFEGDPANGHLTLSQAVEEMGKIARDAIAKAKSQPT